VIYRYGGEGVSIGGAVEYIVRRLADEFVDAGDARLPPSRRWKQVKSYIKSRDLTDRLQSELAAVARYFQARQLAAHAATIIGQVGGSTQVFRMYYDGPDPEVHIITVENLEQEVTEIRAGYEAIQAIGRILDDERPEVLRDWGAIPRAFILGRL
jgi:hypothetical protein